MVIGDTLLTLIS